MKAKILVLLMVLCATSGCGNDDLPTDIDGHYTGTFQRGTNSSNVELLLDDNGFSGGSDIIKFPAICTGAYSTSIRTIKFENHCPWTAEFDWSLILSGTWDFTFLNQTLILTNSIGDKYTLTKHN